MKLSYFKCESDKCTPQAIKIELNSSPWNRRRFYIHSSDILVVPAFLRCLFEYFVEIMVQNCVLPIYHVILSLKTIFIIKDVQFLSEFPLQVWIYQNQMVSSSGKKKLISKVDRR
jgi:hypothetical protein